MVAPILDCSSSVSSDQLTQFREAGYCVVDDLYSEEELQEIEDYFEEYKNSGHRTFHGKNYEEIDFRKEQLRAMHPHRHSKKAEEWFIHPRIAAALKILLGKPALGAQTMYYYKPPGAKGQGMHQDNFYLLAKPATCIAAWTPIDSTDEENGCLWVVPGSHLFDIMCPEPGADRWLGYGDSHISKFPRETKPVPVPVKRGQTMFFGGNLIHGSGPNRSRTRYRRTFIGHYVDAATEQLSKFYNPVLNMQGEVVSVPAFEGGGPCGDDWRGATH